MSDLIARTALDKARYFLAQATSAQSDGAILNDRLPFGANLEAAIIYARSSLDHLKNELKPAHNHAGYKRWHDTKLGSLKKTSPVFEYLTGRRDFIIHQEPEKTNARVSLETHLSLSVSVSVELTVIRADGTIEKHEPVLPEKAPIETPTVPSKATQTFFFADSNWSGKPAVEYVMEFIDACESFLSDAESNFL